MRCAPLRPLPAPAPEPAPTRIRTRADLPLQLISSGRYMKAARQPAEAARMQVTLKRAVSAANERFQDSLDELENEIRLAQTILRRDLAVMRAERKQKEAAVKEKEAEKARVAAESSAKKSAPKDEAAAPPAAAKPDSPVVTKTEPVEPTMGDALSIETGDAPTEKAAEPPADVPMENMDDLNTAQESEFDFDAIFGDSAMDSGADGMNSGDMDLDTAGADLNFTLDEQPSLLRGLEDFAKDATDDSSTQNNNSTNLDLDFAMHDMPEASAAEQPPATTKPAEESTAPQTTEADNDQMNLDTMPTDSLDDLFDLDYVNPEATQFDDALWYDE